MSLIIRCSQEDPSRGRKFRALELCEIGRPGLFISVVRTVSVDAKQHWNIASELRSCVKVEVAVLVPDSPKNGLC